MYLCFAGGTPALFAGARCSHGQRVAVIVHLRMPQVKGGSLHHLTPTRLALLCVTQRSALLYPKVITLMLLYVCFSHRDCFRREIYP